MLGETARHITECTGVTTEPPSRTRRDYGDLLQGIQGLTRGRPYRAEFGTYRQMTNSGVLCAADVPGWNARSKLARNRGAGLLFARALHRDPGFHGQRAQHKPDERTEYLLERQRREKRKRGVGRQCRPESGFHSRSILSREARRTAISAYYRGTRIEGGHSDPETHPAGVETGLRH